ncbi:MAG TPA: Rrf2 family transcriptional regulator [Abditibacterium sp.]|jgi:Rrf2 family protein
MATNCRFAFATHVLSVLASQPDEKFSSEALGHTVNTNPVVIRRLLLDLKDAGLIETQRGPGGGAKLARGADEITLAQIYHAASGEVEPFGEHPHQPAQCCPVGREIKGVLDRVSCRAKRAVEAEFEAVTLADVLKEIQNPVA